MNKYLRLLLCLLVLFSLAGCNATTSKSLSFHVSTGEDVKVTLNTTGNDYKMSNTDPVSITSGDNEVAIIMFATADDIANNKASAEAVGGTVTDKEVIWSVEGQNAKMIIVSENTGVLIVADDIAVFDLISAEVSK